MQSFDSCSSHSVLSQIKLLLRSTKYNGSVDLIQRGHYDDHEKEEKDSEPD